MPKLGATALGYYKLSTPPAPLSHNEARAPATTSNQPTESSNFFLSPNQFSAPVNTSSGPDVYRLAHALLRDVLASLKSPDTHRPFELNLIALGNPEHVSVFLVFAVIVDSEFPTQNCAID
jgi:hypothetical protein